MDPAESSGAVGSPVGGDAPDVVRPPAPRGRRIRWLGYLIAFAGLVWVSASLHPVGALHDLKGIRWGWVALGIILDLLSYVVQGIRWKLLLASFGPVKLTQTVRAIYSGLFANEILPLRSGELLRTYLIARDTRIGFARALTSIGVERLLDGVFLASALGIVALFVPLPASFARAANILGVTVLCILLLFIAGAIYLNLVPVLPANAHPLRHRLRKKLGPMLDVVRTLGVSRGFFAAAGVSPWIPALQILALWAMNLAYGVELPLWSMAAVLLIINMGVALPNAPANVGSYQFFCVLGLTLFGVEKSRAAGFSIAAYVLLTFPFLILGFLALLRSGLSIAAMREQVRELLGGPPRRAPASPSTPPHS